MILLEYLTAPNTSFKCHNFSEMLGAISTDGTIPRQLDYLQQSKWQDEYYGCIEGQELGNASKDGNKFTVSSKVFIYLSLVTIKNII